VPAIDFADENGEFVHHGISSFWSVKMDKIYNDPGFKTGSKIGLKMSF
jgi:hypothetical protein